MQGKMKKIKVDVGIEEFSVNSKGDLEIKYYLNDPKQLEKQEFNMVLESFFDDLDLENNKSLTVKEVEDIINGVEQEEENEFLYW